MFDPTTLHGTGVALVTPLHPDGTLDTAGLARLLAHVDEGGVDYLVVNGTTGESPTLTLAEKRTVLDFVKRHNPRQLPIVFGVGCNCTDEALRAIADTDLTGVAALLSVSPYYNRPSQAGIFEHYRQVADASPVPVLLYNVPARTGSNVAADTVLRLAEHPNVAGIKEAHGDFAQTLAVISHQPEGFLHIAGDDLLTVPMMSVGSVGAISVVANAFPAVFAGLVRQAAAGDFAAASRALYPLLDLNPLLYEEGNPVGIKKVLELAGVCGPYVRLPLLPATEGLTERLRRALARQGLLQLPQARPYITGAWL